MWKYSQWARVLSRNGLCIGEAYSGKGEGKNNHDMEFVPNIGPIPVGRYRIGTAYTHPRKGPLVMRLTPVGHSAKGRNGFLIHGKNKVHPGDSSEGCIILDLEYRRKIAESRDWELEVTK